MLGLFGEVGIFYVDNMDNLLPLVHIRPILSQENTLKTREEINKLT